MNETAPIKASVRKESGKSVAHKLRHNGIIPAILYGHNFTPVMLSVEISEFNKIFKTTTHGSSEYTLHKLTVDGRNDLINENVMIKELQRDPVSNNILHVDFLAVKMDEKITVPVRINLTGKAVGVKLGGILQQILREVDVKCLPSDIPQFFEMDVSPLEIGHSLHVHDILVPDGIEILEDPDAPVVSILAPVVEKQPAAIEAEEAPAETKVPESEEPQTEEKRKTE